MIFAFQKMTWIDCVLTGTTIVSGSISVSGCSSSHVRSSAFCVKIVIFESEIHHLSIENRQFCVSYLMVEPRQVA